MDLQIQCFILEHAMWHVCMCMHTPCVDVNVKCFRVGLQTTTSNKNWEKRSWFWLGKCYT